MIPAKGQRSWDSYSHLSLQLETALHGVNSVVIPVHRAHRQNMFSQLKRAVRGLQVVCQQNLQLESQVVRKCKQNNICYKYDLNQKTKVKHNNELLFGKQLCSESLRRNIKCLNNHLYILRNTLFLRNTYVFPWGSRLGLCLECLARYWLWAPRNRGYMIIAMVLYCKFLIYFDNQPFVIDL